MVPPRSATSIKDFLHPLKDCRIDKQRMLSLPPQNESASLGRARIVTLLPSASSAMPIQGLSAHPPLSAWRDPSEIIPACSVHQRHPSAGATLSCNSAVP